MSSGHFGFGSFSTELLNVSNVWNRPESRSRRARFRSRDRFGRARDVHQLDSALGGATLVAVADVDLGFLEAGMPEEVANRDQVGAVVGEHGGAELADAVGRLGDARRR